MQAFATAIENFVFKAFNIWGRASRSEYWLVMPFIWTLMLVMLVLDIRSFWGFLQAREIPPLNPFAYAFPLLFVLTLPSRISLSVRRLHDSGRAGKWALAPAKAGMLALWFVLGVGTAYLTTQQGMSTALLGAGMFGFGALMHSFGGDQGLWPVAFEIAQTADVWTILRGMADVVGVILQGAPDVSTLATNAASNFTAAQDHMGTQEAAMMLAMTGMMTFGPLILMALYLMFLMMPGTDGANKFGDPSSGTGSAKSGGKGKSSAMSGYAVLSAEGPKAMDPAMHREQVASLYQQRVLAKKSTSEEPEIYRAAR